jgi:hypothetical protein
MVVKVGEEVSLEVATNLTNAGSLCADSVATVAMDNNPGFVTLSATGFLLVAPSSVEDVGSVTFVIY